MATYNDTPNYGKGAPALLFIKDGTVWREAATSDFAGTGGGVGGDASAANQVLEITELTDINSKLIDVTNARGTVTKTEYVVKNAFTNCSVGDILLCLNSWEQNYSQDIGNVTANTWYNQNAQIFLDNPPNFSDIVLKGNYQTGSGDTSETTQRVYVADTKVVDCSFTKTGSGLVADEVVQIGPVGTGMTVAQAYGNLTVDTGTTVNSDFLMRSVDSIKGGHIVRVKVQLSQKIVNQHFSTYLADMIGENVAFTTDATGLLISVTIPGHTFTSANIGQSCYLGGGSGAANIVPGRYAITAVSGSVVTFSPRFDCTWTRSTTTATATFLGGNPIFSLNETATVSASSDTAAIVNGVVTLLTQVSGGITTFTCLNAGAASGTLTLTMTAKAWTGNASGTITVFGWNCISLVKNGTSATASWFDSQRRGWGSGASTVTTTTDASPGQLFQFSGDTTSEFLSDTTVATTTTLQFVSRASRMESLIDHDTPLYLFLEASNGVTAPASSTRLTVGKFSLEQTGINKVIIAGVSQTGTGNGQRVTVDGGTLSITANSAMNIAQWAGQNTITGGVNGTVAVGGIAAHSAASTGNPVRVGSKVITALDTSLINGDNSDLLSDTNGSVAVMPYSIAPANINIVAPAGGTITNSTTAVVVHAAPAAGVRNFYTAIQLATDALGAATELVLRDVALTCSSQTISANTLTTSTAHGLSIGDAVVASASGVTGLTAGITYYVLTVPSTTTLTFSATRGGSTLAISGTSVTATINHILWRTKLQTSSLPITYIPLPSPIRGGSAVAQDLVTLTASVTGSVFFSAQGYQSA